jgi:hypothetical protein
MSDYMRSVLMLVVSIVSLLTLLVAAVKFPVSDGYVLSGLFLSAFINTFAIVVNAIRVFKT